jgi:hypothetical protein
VPRRCCFPHPPPGAGPSRSWPEAKPERRRRPPPPQAGQSDPLARPGPPRAHGRGTTRSRSSRAPRR